MHFVIYFHQEPNWTWWGGWSRQIFTWCLRNIIKATSSDAIFILNILGIEILAHRKFHRFGPTFPNNLMKMENMLYAANAHSSKSWKWKLAVVHGWISCLNLTFFVWYDLRKKYYSFESLYQKKLSFWAICKSLYIQN